MKPWELVPGFKEQHLVDFALVVVGGHNLRRKTHQPKNGDDSYTFGCGRYGRFRNAMIARSRGEEMPWLEVDVGHGLALVIRISGTEIVPFHGDPTCPGYRARRHGKKNLAAPGQTYLPGWEPLDGWFYGIALDSDNKLRISRVVFEEVHVSGKTRHAWPIPVNVNYCLPDLHAEPQPQNAQTKSIVARPQQAPTPTFGPKPGVRSSDVSDDVQS